MAKAIMPVLDVLKGRIADTNQRLTSQYRMMQMAHHRYNLLFRWTYEMLMIHHFALLLFKNYLTIQVGMLQRIHHQYCYIVGLGLNCKFIDLLFKRSFIKFIEISSHLDFIVSEIIDNQTITLTQGLMDLR